MYSVVQLEQTTISVAFCLDRAALFQSLTVTAIEKEIAITFLYILTETATQSVSALLLM